MGMRTCRGRHRAQYRKRPEDIINKLNILLTFILLPTLACRLTPAEPADDLGCTEDVAAMLTLLGGLAIPDNFIAEEPIRTGDEFDPNQFFTVLGHLSMASGYTLDYIYHRDGLGAYPMLYARPVDQARYTTEAEFSAAGEDPATYLEYVQVDDTDEGYFQFVVFALMSHQFYLDWHANYNDTLVVCTRAAAVEIADNLDSGIGYPMPAEDRIKVGQMEDVEPAVSLVGQTYRVQIVTFSNWGGFSRVIFSISQSFPHTILVIQDELLVPYDCGIMF